MCPVQCVTYVSGRSCLVIWPSFTSCEVNLRGAFTWAQPTIWKDASANICGDTAQLLVVEVLGNSFIKNDSILCWKHGSARGLLFIGPDGDHDGDEKEIFAEDSPGQLRILARGRSRIDRLKALFRGSNTTGR